MSTIEELEQKLETNREKRAEAETAQYAKDLEARIELEEEHGVLSEVKATKFVEGQPTRAFLRTPRAPEYKRYKDQLTRAIATKNQKAQTEAGETLGKACWVYPRQTPDGGVSDEQKAMLEAFPGLLVTIGFVATRLAEGKMDDAGKD